MKTRILKANHWRFRLMHWYHNVKSIETSNLPQYLYTHYCPLFHYTNFLAIIFPFVVFFGFIRDVICYAVARITEPLGLIADIFDKWYWTEARRKQSHFNYAYYYMRKYFKEGYSIQDWQNYFGYADLTEKDYEILLELVLLKRKKKVEAQTKVRELEQTDDFVYWINLSQKVLKVVFSIFYVLAALVIFNAALIGSYFILFLISLLCITVASHLTGTVLVLLTILVISLSILSIAYIIYNFNTIIQYSICAKSISKFRIFFGIIKDFIVMFYENNCPPIEIEE